MYVGFSLLQVGFAHSHLGAVLPDQLEGGADVFKPAVHIAEHRQPLSPVVQLDGVGLGVEDVLGGADDPEELVVVQGLAVPGLGQDGPLRGGEGHVAAVEDGRTGNKDNKNERDGTGNKRRKKNKDKTEVFIFS